MTLRMRNTETHEEAPAHLIGQDDQGRDIYQHVDGWELVGGGFGPEIDSECDEDGNYHVAT